MKEKTTTRAADRPLNEPAGDGETIIDVARDGTATKRENGAPDPKPTGPAAADEDPDYSPMDTSPARNKDRMREQPYDDPGPENDTYD